MIQIINFNDLKIGAMFELNGTSYRKKSSRTASLLENGAWFYFGLKERVRALT